MELRAAGERQAKEELRLVKAQHEEECNALRSEHEEDRRQAAKVRWCAHVGERQTK